MHMILSDKNDRGYGNENAERLSRDLGTYWM